MKRRILLLGAGKIGTLIACLLDESGSYEVDVGSLEIEESADAVDGAEPGRPRRFQLDASDERALAWALDSRDYSAVVSALPYYCNPTVAALAARRQINYFDLTEDVAATRRVKELAAGSRSVFMPQCGLAPGFISIAANELLQHFEELDMAKMRVGALPVNPSNALKYSLTWSTDGLINEYGNTCYGIHDRELVAMQPLEGYETITLDGVLYEAFNTSGGLGTLAETYAGKIRSMTYKTVRYPGHREQIHFLMNELRLNDDRATLKRILENAVPKTLQDVVLVYVAVTGRRGGELMEENFARKFYPQTIGGRRWSSIQVTTAAGLCGVMDIVLEQPDRFAGFVTQEQIGLQELLDNRFGEFFAQ